MVKKLHLLRVGLCVYVLVATIAVWPMSSANAQGGPVMSGVPAAAFVCLNPALPFVWLRATPSSRGSVVGTLFPTNYQRLTTTRQDHFDGVQWWLRVYAFPNSRRLLLGWVEQGSFVQGGCGAPPVAPGAPPRPNLSGTLCVASNNRFVVERPAPSVLALGQIVAASAPCVNNGLPARVSMNEYYWDGVRWWVQIGRPPREFSSRAWIDARTLQQAPQ